jgi:hypothetical protein
MVYAIVVGACADCSTPFSFNPRRVPSKRINGTREPICRRCFHRNNKLRRAAGLPTYTLRADAYGPCSEGELDD